MARFVFLALALFLTAAPAGALTISVVVLGLDASNTPDDLVTGATHNTSSASVLNSGGTVADTVAATQGLQARYQSNLWSDASFGGQFTTTTNSFNLHFSVTADPGTTYDITIDSLINGAFRVVDETSYGYVDGLGVSASTVTLDGTPNAALGTAAYEVPDDYGSYTYYDTEVAYTDSGQETMAGLTGTTSAVVNVEWTSFANSYNDEAGILLGLPEAGGTGGVTASDYGELGTARDPNLDGFFLTITATVTNVSSIPEPSTALLLGMGLTIVAAGRHRR